MKEDYPLYVHWLDATDWILSTAENFPKNARFSLASRVADETLDAMEGIVEAIYVKDRLPVLNRVNMSFEKLRVFFRISHKRRYISMRRYEYASRLIDEAGRMTGGWMRSSREKSR